MTVFFMLIDLVYRLKPTRAELGGWPPLVVSFQHFYDKEAVLKRTDMLDRSGLIITEDMSRAVREHWGELNKFMARVRKVVITVQGRQGALGRAQQVHGQDKEGSYHCPWPSGSTGAS